MLIAHLMASPFFGGPEKQMLGLARHLPPTHRSVFLSFSERGRCRPFLEEVRREHFDGIELAHNFPDFRRAIDEVALSLRRLRADLLTCSGYKPDLIGWLAARRLGIPVVTICHGWTAATWKVRLNEALDRCVVRWVDKVVCVSQAQANQLRQARVAADRIAVIRNAIGAEAFAAPDPAFRDRLRELFRAPPRWIVGAAGRLSPEKGFDQLVQAAADFSRLADRLDIGLVIFGAGPLRETLSARIAALGLQERVVLAGFHADLGKYLPHFDLTVIPSFTEGLPVILLEAFAAGVPVVATSVGGIPEVIDDGVSGWLVPPGNPECLAERIVAMFQDDVRRRAMGAAGRERVRRQFLFDRLACEYQQLFDGLVSRSRLGARRVPRER